MPPKTPSKPAASSSPAKTKRTPTPSKGSTKTAAAAAADDADSLPAKRTKGEEKEEDTTTIVKRQSTRGTAVTEEAVLEGTVPFKRITDDKDFDSNKMLKIISWNVAGLRAVLKKGTQLQDLIKKESPDMLCLQETKLSDWKDAATTGVIPGYSFYDSISVAKKGYAGTRTYVKDGAEVTHFPGFQVPQSDTHDHNAIHLHCKSWGHEKHDAEGRIVTTLDAQHKFALMNTYVPNAGMTLERLPYRVNTFDPMMRGFVNDVKHKINVPVIWTGDLNVAEKDYDRFFSSNFKQMQKSPGFTPEERESFRKTLTDTKSVDIFRSLYPNASKVYSFWSARFNQRSKNNGWRLDYFVLSKALVPRVVDCFMDSSYTASDHCPVILWLKK